MPVEWFEWGDPQPEKPHRIYRLDKGRSHPAILLAAPIGAWFHYVDRVGNFPCLPKCEFCTKPRYPRYYAPTVIRPRKDQPRDNVVLELNDGNIAKLWDLQPEWPLIVTLSRSGFAKSRLELAVAADQKLPVTLPAAWDVKADICRIMGVPAGQALQEPEIYNFRKLA
jgi:hypothetical protein